MLIYSQCKRGSKAQSRLMTENTEINLFSPSLCAVMSDSGVGSDALMGPKLYFRIATNAVLFVYQFERLDIFCRSITNISSPEAMTPSVRKT